MLDEFLTKESALNAVILLSLTCVGDKEQVKPSYTSASLYNPKFLRDFIIKTACFTNIAKIWPYISSLALPDIKYAQLL